MRTLMAALTASLAVTACGQNTTSGDAESGNAAPGSPKVNAGLWEIKHTVMGVEEVMRQCLEDPLDASRPFLTTQPDNNCTADRKAIPGGFHQINHCEVLGAKTVVDMTFTGGGDAFELSSAISAEASSAAATVMKGRRLGPCPSGMNDGDTVE